MYLHFGGGRFRPKTRLWLLMKFMLITDIDINNRLGQVRLLGGSSILKTLATEHTDATKTLKKDKHKLPQD